MTTCTNVLFPKQIFQKRTKAYMGIHVTNSCMYSKEVLWGLGGCAGDCAQFTSSGGVSPQDLVHIAGYVFPRQAAGEESSGMPDPAYIGVVTSLAGAFSSGQYRWCHMCLQFWVTVFKQWGCVFGQYRWCHVCLQFWVTVFKQWRPCFHCVQLLMSESTILHCVSKMCWLCSVNENVFIWLRKVCFSKYESV